MGMFDDVRIGGLVPCWKCGKNISDDWQTKDEESGPSVRPPQGDDT